MNDTRQRDYKFEFVVEGATLDQVQSLLRIILDWIELSKLRMGGGFEPVDEQEACDEQTA